jgi:regulator of protease activity HflC (stomatin/prohibitin superfamily)
MTPTLIGVFVLAALFVVVIIKTAVIVPQKSEFIIERLGKYNKTLSAGFHILAPFLDRSTVKIPLAFFLQRKIS